MSTEILKYFVLMVLGFSFSCYLQILRWEMYIGLIYVNILKVKLFIYIHTLCKFESLQAAYWSLPEFMVLYSRGANYVRKQTLRHPVYHIQCIIILR